MKLYCLLPSEFSSSMEAIIMSKSELKGHVENGILQRSNRLTAPGCVMTVISVEWQTWKLSTEPFPSLYVTVSLDDFQYRHRKWRTTYQLSKGFPLLIFMQGVFQVTFGWFVSYHCLSHASLWVGEAMNFFVFWYGNLLWRKITLWHSVFTNPCKDGIWQKDWETKSIRDSQKSFEIKDKYWLNMPRQHLVTVGFWHVLWTSSHKQSRCPCR